MCSIRIAQKRHSQDRPAVHILVSARNRLGAGRRLDSPALVADGYHARTDGFVSLGVMLSAALVALGLPVADPIIAVVITGVILRITVQSWRTVQGRGHPRAS